MKTQRFVKVWLTELLLNFIFTLNFSELAFQHHRINNDGNGSIHNVEIMNPIFNLEHANNETENENPIDQSLMNQSIENENEFIVNYMVSHTRLLNTFLI